MNKTARKIVGWGLMTPLFVVAVLGTVGIVITFFRNANKDDLHLLFGTIFVLLCTAIGVKVLFKD